MLLIMIVNFIKLVIGSLYYVIFGGQRNARLIDETKFYLSKVSAFLMIFNLSNNLRNSN